MFVMQCVWAKELATNIVRTTSLNRAQCAKSGQTTWTSVQNKCIRHDLPHVLQKGAFWADNDATDCHEHIVYDAAFLALMRIGPADRAGRFDKKQSTASKHRILPGGKALGE